MIVAVGSWRGTGASTSALLIARCLAMRDQAATWLIEADPAGGAIAGRMQVAGDTIGGLERIAFPTERMSPVEAFNVAAHQLAGVRIVSAPSDPFRAHACHQPRLPWVSSLRDLSGDVVIDVGRLRSSTPVWPILQIADVVLIATSPEVSAAVSTSEWLQADGRVSPADPGFAANSARLLFVDAPAGVAFPRATLAAELGERFAGWLPWEPVAVDLIQRGAAPDDRRLRRSALMAAISELAFEITIRERVDA